MEAQQSTGKYWLYFAVSTAVMVGLMIYKREFFWLALPFVTTYFAKGLKLF